MPKISNEKIEKIQEQILSFLYSQFPKPIFTSKIADELARDEEFIKKILINLEKKTFIIKVDKNSQGIRYSQRARWRLSNKIYEVYKNHQPTTK